MIETAPPPWITVVSGLPRSGTSMMMQMLVAGGLRALADHQRAADEDNQRGYFEFEPVKRTRDDRAWLPDAVGKAVKIIYALLTDLPPGYEYRVVFMRREMDEVLASQRAMLARRGESGAALSEAQMAEAFSRQLAKVDAWLRERPHFRTLDVDYQAVLKSPSEQAARINEFLDRRLDSAAMAAAVEPALRRQGRDA